MIDGKKSSTSIFVVVVDVIAVVLCVEHLP